MKIVVGILLTCLLLSCAGNQKKQTYLSENKMKEVMWDMIRADQYVGQYLLKDSTKMKIDESVKLYDQIFKLHHTTREEFRRSFDYYSSRPDLFRPIIDSLAVRKDQHAPFF